MIYTHHTAPCKGLHSKTMAQLGSKKGSVTSTSKKEQKTPSFIPVVIFPKTGKCHLLSVELVALSAKEELGCYIVRRNDTHFGDEHS